jgi:hypothetical protein
MIRQKEHHSLAEVLGDTIRNNHFWWPLTHPFVPKSRISNKFWAFTAYFITFFDVVL